MTRTLYTFTCLLFVATAIGYGASFLWNIQDKEGISVPFGVLWHQAKYFTIWTNVLVMCLSAWMVLKRRPISDSLFAAITLWLLVVMIVWHVLLGDDEPKYGLDHISNLFGHTLNPILLLLGWCLVAPKSNLRWRDPLIWLIWPALYVVCATTRGLLTDFYPYFFLNLTELGWAGFLSWVGTFLIVFFVGGTAIVALGKLILRIAPNTEPHLERET